MNKRIISWFLVVILLTAFLPQGMASAAEAVKEFGNYIPGAHIVRSAAVVSVMLTGSRRDTSDPDAWKNEIRVFSFDPERGVFENGEGRGPGDETQWGRWLEDGYGYTVQLNKPGKYLLSGVPYYVLDPAEERQASLLNELDEMLYKYESSSQVSTGTALYKWLQKRVKPKLPADPPDLAEICRDPLNALLTGYISQEAYPSLLQLIMSLGRIRTVLVDGKYTVKGTETDWVWAYCELDEKWLCADPALDAGKAARFGMEESAIQKDHVLSESAERFVHDYIRSAYIDVLLRNDQELEPRLRLGNNNEGYYTFIDFIDGPLYSLGPSGDVSVRIYRNFTDTSLNGMSSSQLKEEILRNLIYQRLDWDPTYQTFRNPRAIDQKEYDRSRTITAKDVTVVEYDKELSRLVLRFNTPGLYKFICEGDFFCVLDPNDETQVRIAQMLDEAKDSLYGETDRETAKKIQDWEASKLKYDREAYRLINKFVWGNDDFSDGEEYTKEIGEQTDASQDAFSALATGLSVCGGYSNLYALLLKNAGIPAFQVSGYLRSRGMGHAWNIVRIDGKWLYADPTWDDKGSSSSTKYFLCTHEQYAKHHEEFGGEDSFIKELFETTVYHAMYHRFDTRYAVKVDLPDFLRALPGDVSGYDFPKYDPPFIKFSKWVIDDDHIEYGFGTTRVALATCKRNMRGESYETYDDDMLDFHSNVENWRYYKGMIFEMRVQDYPKKQRPTKKPSVSQEYVWARTVLEEARLGYTVPLKKGEIPGYTETSSRTWIYDQDMNKTGMSWNLEKDGNELTVTVSFNAEGKTDRVSVLLTPPSGGNGIGWETDRNGHVSFLRLDDGNDTWLLQEMNDIWLRNQQESFRRALLRKYPSLSDAEPLEEGIHLYRFSKDHLVTVEEYLYYNRPNLFGGKVFATRDELFYWDEDGHLQLNTNVRDLNGDPFSVQMGRNMDLSMCTRLLITD